MIADYISRLFAVYIVVVFFSDENGSESSEHIPTCHIEIAKLLTSTLGLAQFQNGHDKLLLIFKVL